MGVSIVMCPHAIILVERSPLEQKWGGSSRPSRPASDGLAYSAVATATYYLHLGFHLAATYQCLCGPLHNLSKAISPNPLSLHEGLVCETNSQL